MLSYLDFLAWKPDFFTFWVGHFSHFFETFWAYISNTKNFEKFLRRFFLTKIFIRIDLKNQKKFLVDFWGCVFGQPEGYHFLTKNSKTSDFWEILMKKSIGQKPRNNLFLGSDFDFFVRKADFWTFWAGHFSRFFGLWGRFSRNFPIVLENVLT